MNRYSLIYADPAWSYGNTISNGAAVDHYPTMSLLDMKRLPVWELAADNAVLAMWYTGTHNQEAIELAEAWGFTVRTMKGFTWVKLNQLAELRITKALADGDVTDFYDFLALLNAETRMNGGNHTRQGRINTASIDRFNNDFEPLSHEEAQQIKADLEQSEHIKKLRSQRAA